MQDMNLDGLLGAPRELPILSCVLTCWFCFTDACQRTTILCFYSWVQVVGVTHADPCWFAHVWAKHKLAGVPIEPDSRYKLGYQPSHCSVSTFEFTKKDVVEPSDSMYFSHTYSSAFVHNKK